MISPLAWSQLLVLLLLTGCMSVNPRSDVTVDEEVDQASTRQSKDVRPTQPKVLATIAAPETQLVEENNDAQVYSLDETPAFEKRQLSAIDMLTEEADNQQSEGDLDGAITTLERALRIEPRNPHLWNRLARIRMLQQQFKQASDLAQRSNALTEKGAPIRHDNWRIIADVRRMERDFSGAREADQRAATLQ